MKYVFRFSYTDTVKIVDPELLRNTLYENQGCQTQSHSNETYFCFSCRVTKVSKQHFRPNENSMRRAITLAYSVRVSQKQKDFLGFSNKTIGNPQEVYEIFKE